MKTGSLTIVLLMLLVAGCNRQKELAPGLLGYDYYPIAIGQYRVYDVEEIDYKLAGFDTTSYQLKETIFDSIVSADQVSYLIRRDKRATPGESWESDSVWMVTRTAHYLSINENNIPLIKLTFPVAEGRSWDGNSLNARPGSIYTFSAQDTVIVDSIALRDHIRLIVSDVPKNVVNQDQRVEVYARNVGLVSKHYLTLEFCTANCDMLGEIQAGRFLHQVLIEKGNENE